MLPKVDVVKRDPLVTLQDVIPQYLSKIKVINGYDEESLSVIVKKWETIVGSAIAAKSKPLKIENKTLFIKVQSGAWKTELTYRKKVILQKVKELLSDESVQNISLRS